MKVRLFDENGNCIQIEKIQSVILLDDNSNPFYVSTQLDKNNTLGVSAGDNSFRELVKKFDLREPKIVQLKTDIC